MKIIQLPKLKATLDFSTVSLTKTVIDGEHGLSVDGTGKDPSVGEGVGNAIANYIKAKFQCEEQLRVLDVGTGKGYMVNGLINAGIDGYGIEGSSSVANSALCPKDRIACIDLSKPLGNKLCEKPFHLTTSFEVMEHIHRRHEDTFIVNLSKLADYHLCSIHMAGWPGVTTEHCNIKHECCWLEVFRKYNIKCDVIGRASKDHADGHYDHLPGSAPSTRVGGNEEVRDFVKFNQWGEWECSMFCLLNFKEFQLCE